MYVLLEDDNDKFWIYEMYPEEMCRVLDECSLCDIYITSKKYEWIVSENHSGGLYFVGDITPPDKLISALQQLRTRSESQRAPEDGRIEHPARNHLYKCRHHTIEHPLPDVVVPDI